jgi:regulator of protease activity HflC (stomatin/prohibitin superfamily)
MHPMFKELFIQTDADDLAAEEDRRRRVRRSRRARPAMIIRPAANRQNRSRP